MVDSGTAIHTWVMWLHLCVSFSIDVENEMEQTGGAGALLYVLYPAKELSGELRCFNNLFTCSHTATQSYTQKSQNMVTPRVLAGDLRRKRRRRRWRYNWKSAQHNSNLNISVLSHNVLGTVLCEKEKKKKKQERKKNNKKQTNKSPSQQSAFGSDHVSNNNSHPLVTGYMLCRAGIWTM